MAATKKADGETTVSTAGSATKTTSKRTVPEGETWTFRCVKKCFWDRRLWYGTKDLAKGHEGEASLVTFEGPTEIPANFQFENWERIS